MGYIARGHVIRELLRLLRALDSKKAKTVKDISSESGMELQQTYRWLDALETEKMVDKFDRSPARYRLKPIGTRLRQNMRTENSAFGHIAFLYFRRRRGASRKNGMKQKL